MFERYNGTIATVGERSVDVFLGLLQGSTEHARCSTTAVAAFISACHYIWGDCCRKAFDIVRTRKWVTRLGPLASSVIIRLAHHLQQLSRASGMVRVGDLGVSRYSGATLDPTTAALGSASIARELMASDKGKCKAMIAASAFSPI